jgi:hypothetical protein
MKRLSTWRLTFETRPRLCIRHLPDSLCWDPIERRVATDAVKVPTHSGWIRTFSFPNVELASLGLWNSPPKPSKPGTPLCQLRLFLSITCRVRAKRDPADLGDDRGRRIRGRRARRNVSTRCSARSGRHPPARTGNTGSGKPLT